MLSLPALELLREEHPKAHITLLVGQACAPLVQDHPALNRLWVIEERLFWQKKVVALVRLAWQLRQQRFDQVYILHWSPLFHRFFQLIGIPVRWGFARDAHAQALTRSVPYVEGGSAAHDVSQYIAAVSERHVVSGQPLRQPRIVLSDAEKEAASMRIKHAGYTLVVAPGGGNNAKLFMPQKRWPAKRFAELAERLILEERVSLCVVGDASEAALLEPLHQKYPEHVTMLAGALSLRETAAVIAVCRLFIGNDSGLFHIAGAVGTPPIVFFGPTSPHGKMPLWLAHRLLYSQEPCSPCYKHGSAPPCPYDLKCMEHISVSQALAATTDLLHHH